jgi:hypothetical protein
MTIVKRIKARLSRLRVGHGPLGIAVDGRPQGVVRVRGGGLTWVRHWSEVLRGLNVLADAQGGLGDEATQLRYHAVRAALARLKRARLPTEES